MMLGGVEEAGRGPVIGPLVVAIAAIDEEKEIELEQLGVTDSKELTPKQREALYETVVEHCKYEILIVSPKEIDDALESTSSNLNWLEATKMAELINKIKPEKVIVDAPSNNLEAFEDFMKKKLTFKPELIVKHKADRDHTIVGAASILAKVTRDKEIQKLKQEIGVDFGSGYPSDPKTIAFLKENWDKYPIFRKTWSTWKKLAKSKKQKKIGEY